MRAAGCLILFSTLLAACSAPCPDRPILDTPEHTIDTFHRAFACDDMRTEYACFSDDVKRSFHGVAGYGLGRAILRDEHPWVVAFVGYADVAARTRVEILEGGTAAIATIDGAGGDGDPLRLRLAYEPEYRLMHADGSVTHAYADESLARAVFPRRIELVLIDDDLEIEAKDPDTPIQRFEVLPRWVISGFPGIEDAIEAARRPAPRP